MKKISTVLFAAFIFMCFMSSPVMADSFLADHLPYTNPQLLGNSGDATEEAWIEGLLGLTYDDPAVEFLSKLEEEPFFDVTPPAGTHYYLLKFGGGQGQGIPDHYAFQYDGIGTLEPASALLAFNLGIDPDIVSPKTGLSHISYFGEQVAHTPVPATIYLLGTGIVGLAGIRRKAKKSRGLD